MKPVAISQVQFLVTVYMPVVVASVADGQTAQKTVEIPTNAVLGRFRPDGADTRDDSTVAVFGQGCGHACYSGVQTCKQL